MKLTKILGVAVVAAFALMAFAGTASATTLETNGVKKAEAIELRASLKTATSALLKDTSGAFANTCTSSKVEGKDTTAFTAKESGAISGPIKVEEPKPGEKIFGLSFTSCTHSPVVVDAAGSLSVEWIKGTTNGTVKSSGAEVTVPATILGSVVTVNCKTSGTDLGTLTGVKEGSATIDINAVLNCGSFLPSAKWEGSYVTTTLNSEGKEIAHAIGVVE